MTTLRNSLVIFGAGGHGRVVASTAQAAGWDKISFIDPQWPDLQHSGEWPVEGDGSDPAIVGGRAAIVAIGDNQRRLALIEALTRAGLDIATIIHPTAWVCPGVLIGAGTVIGAQAVVNHGASLGRGVIINSGAIVEHDCLLADGVHVSPGAVLAGNVEAGHCVWIGTGANICPGLQISERATIGAGATVISHVPSDATYAGVPARALAERPKP